MPVAALLVVVVLTVAVLATVLVLDDLTVLEGEEGEVPLQLKTDGPIIQDEGAERLICKGTNQE
jgi:hypothetical protein